jgi:DNA-binding transcriptional ArsR family regulator
VTRPDPADAVFSALADPTRRALLRAVTERAPVTATELAAELPISRQAVAKHLGVLGDAGLVTPSRVGREARYEARPDQLSAATDWITETAAAWDVRLDRLEQRLRAKRTDPGNSRQPGSRGEPD